MMGWFPIIPNVDPQNTTALILGTPKIVSPILGKPHGFMGSEEIHCAKMRDFSGQREEESM